MMAEMESPVVMASVLGVFQELSLSTDNVQNACGGHNPLMVPT